MMARSDREARGGIQDALPARFLFRGDIYRWIAASMTLYSVCVIFLIGAVSYVCVDLLIRKNLRLSMESSARQQAVKLSTSLDSLQESLSHLSRNSLLVNAIIDTSGSRSYIDSFVKSYRPAGHGSIRLTLCDFQGNPITANLQTPIPYKTPELLRQTVEKGLPFSTVLPREGTDNGASFLLAYPVVWNMTGQAEGILVAEVPVGEIVDDQLLSMGNIDTGFRMMSGERILFSRDFVDGQGFQQFEVPLSATAPLKDLMLSMRIENHRRISLWWLIPAYAVSAGILLLLSMILARRISFSVTSHLRALGAVAQQIAESGSLDSHAEVAGPDDVKLLASSFNAMIDRVRSSKEDLEGRVEERTADLSVANEELLRLNLEKEVAIDRLQEALEKISTLRGLVPICSACKKIRDDKGYWSQIETYISKHTEAEFSHGICPDCAKELYGEYGENLE
jgi:HAMP domain-containing protein